MSEASEEEVREIILDSIADGMFTVDGDWNITSFNRAAEQITGIPREQAIGQKCFDVFHANICQTACALRETMASGRQRVDRRVDILNSQGEKVPVSVSTAVLRNATGELVGGVETFRDLSEVELLCRGQLRRPARHAPGVRTVRIQEGCLYGRQEGQAGPLRIG